MDKEALSNDLNGVHDFVDDDLLSCFLWAAGENAVAQPGWESPSVIPLKGIPLPPAMAPLPPAAPVAATKTSGPGEFTIGALPAQATETAEDEKKAMGAAELDDLHGLDEDDIADISTSFGQPLSKEQKLTQRMQRKAESARVARLRKKEYVSGLEAEVAKLKAELAIVRESGSKTGPSTCEPPSLREEGQRQLTQMDELLRRPSLEKFVPEVNATVEKYVANKRAQQAPSAQSQALPSVQIMPTLALAPITRDLKSARLCSTGND